MGSEESFSSASQALKNMHGSIQENTLSWLLRLITMPNFGFSVAEVGEVGFCTGEPFTFTDAVCLSAEVSFTFLEAEDVAVSTSMGVGAVEGVDVVVTGGGFLRGGWSTE